MNETQTTTAPAGSSTDSSSVDTSNAGRTNLQPTDGGAVDTTGVEDNGNSGSSDVNDGSNSGESGRQRATEAERRISELTAKIRNLESNQLQQSNQVAQYLAQPNTTPNLPDYSDQSEVYPAQLAKDIYAAVSRDMEAKLAGTTGLLQNQIDYRNTVQRNISEAETARTQYAALNESNPDTFDPDLAKEIDDGFIEIFEVNPKYSYASHVKKFKSVLQRVNTNTDTTDTTAQAIRPQNQTKRQRAFSKDMSTVEMKEWFANRR